MTATVTQTSLKSEFALFQKFIELIPGLCQSTGKEWEFRFLLFRFSQNVKLGIFTSWSCSDGKEM